MKHKGDIDLEGNDIVDVNNLTASNITGGLEVLSDVSFSGPPAEDDFLMYDGSDWTNDTITIARVTNLQTELDSHINIDSVSGSAGAVGDGAKYFSNFDSGATLTAGKLYYLHATTGWEEADASAASTSTNLLAMCTSASTNGTSMLQSGVINAFGSQAAAAVGVPMYVSETSGEITPTAPTTSGAIARVIGYKVDNTDDTIFFNPSNDWIEIS